MIASASVKFRSARPRRARTGRGSPALARGDGDPDHARRRAAARSSSRPAQRKMADHQRRRTPPSGWWSPATTPASHSIGQLDQAWKRPGPASAARDDDHARAAAGRRASSAPTMLFVNVEGADREQRLRGDVDVDQALTLSSSGNSISCIAFRATSQIVYIAAADPERGPHQDEERSGSEPAVEQEPAAEADHHRDARAGSRDRTAPVGRCVAPVGSSAGPDHRHATASVAPRARARRRMQSQIPMAETRLRAAGRRARKSARFPGCHVEHEPDDHAAEHRESP